VPKKIRRASPRPYHHGDLRRALIDTALELVTEEQDWTFSLREVARRAGVSPHAPYNHFSDKQELLGAVAVVGFERLRVGLLRAVAGNDAPEGLLALIGRTYVRLGLENPALYRLMFSSALADVGPGDRPTIVRSTGAQARAVLEEVIRRGARSGAFAVSPDSPQDQILAALSFWSGVHGLTMLVIDNISGTDLPVDDRIERLLRTLVEGLGQARAQQSRQPSQATARDHI
jgi:AcrR family transcriptional regulator